jgi:hypothetical protein
MTITERGLRLELFAEKDLTFLVRETVIAGPGMQDSDTTHGLNWRKCSGATNNTLRRATREKADKRERRCPD